MICYVADHIQDGLVYLVDDDGNRTAVPCEHIRGDLHEGCVVEYRPKEGYFANPDAETELREQAKAALGRLFRRGK